MKIFALQNKHIVLIVWILRIIVGGTFIFSGFSKVVDPWGFMYKMLEYLSAWHISYLPHEAVLIAGAMLALCEFCCGVMLLFGCWRRVISRLVALIMCFMLLVSLYIVIFNPVEDCGCFGEALVISNEATFIKNIFLTVFAFVLVACNRYARSIFHPLMQWLVMLTSIIYCLMLAVIGYVFQPMYDFRPYPVGSSMTEDTGDSGLQMLYEKDGVTKAFSVDDLPGDDWTYVGRQQQTNEDKLIAIFDGFEDVTSEVFSDEGPQMVLVVSNPQFHNRARSSMCNSLNEYMESQGGNMIALVALPSQRLNAWKNLSNPDYEVYSADDTSLKEMVRGDAALVYLYDGKIVWKRNLYFLSSTFPDQLKTGHKIEDIFIPDSGRPLKVLTLIYVLTLFIPFLLGLPFLRKKRKKIFNNRNND